MHFKKVEIIGFKSFAEKTVLHFEPGVTAIVGPNGCGKSNIFDAIRWVLGEQSIKSLRGTKMEDVIFNGTEKIPPLNFAEVNLTFSNENKMLPIDYEEVTISRRLFRSGESEYLLNKTQVRLKDIAELLMGTGIGAESYSLVEQGKIDLVLSSKAEDRRLVFDEAAGVTKYKAKKKEALNKLEDTQNNLLRINDITTEVKRQIASLERQANKARRYKEEFERLKSMELNLSTFQVAQIQKQKQDFQIKLEEFKKGQLNSELTLQGLRNKLSQGRLDLEAIEFDTSQMRQLLSSHENNIQASQNHIQINLERIQELQLRQNNISAQKDDILKRIASDEEKITTLKNDLESLDSKVEEKSRQIEEKEGLLEHIGSVIKDAQQVIAQSKNRLLDLAAFEAKTRNDINEKNSILQSALGRKKRLDLEKEKVLNEKSIIEDKSKAISSQLKEAQDEFKRLKEHLFMQKSELGQDTKDLENIKQNLSLLEKELVSLLSQKEFIEKLELKYNDSSSLGESVIFTDTPPSPEANGVLSKVKQIRELDIKEKELLKRNFKDKDLNFMLTCEAKPMPLDTSKLIEKIRHAEEQIQNFTNKSLLKQEKIDAGILAINKQEELILNGQIVLENKKSALDSAKQDLGKISDELGVVILEIDELDAQIKESKQALDKSNLRLSEFETEEANTKEKITSSQELISKELSARENTLVEMAELKTQIHAIHETKVSGKDTLALLDETLKQDKANLDLYEREFLDYTAKAKELRFQNSGLEERIKELGVKKNEMQAQICEIIEKKKQNLNLLEEDEIKVRSIEKELDGFKKNIYGLQIQDQEASFKVANIMERILEAYKLNLDKDCKDVPQDFIADKASEEISRIKEKIDAFGQVNLVAIEEYDELKKRFEFLTEQQNDLLASKDSLLKAIGKINRTTKELFLGTFEKIGEEFRNYFRLLFGGGDAQLILMDENDCLESGIEIICRPPGKKLQNIMLLSGGEKTLSAIALIFAIFKVKPSPFCILDEIDAALDETNIGRFNRLLEEFLSRSQFIIITHNKKTITNADIMYGITMQQSGISKIVSVKFANDKNDKTDSAQKQPLEPVTAN